MLLVFWWWFSRRSTHMKRIYAFARHRDQTVFQYQWKHFKNTDMVVCVAMFLVKIRSLDAQASEAFVH